VTGLAIAVRFGVRLRSTCGNLPGGVLENLKARCDAATEDVAPELVKASRKDNSRQVSSR
jgi:hypothetical protein